MFNITTSIFYTPLEQFQLSIFYPLYINFCDFSITNFSITIFMISLLIYISFFFFSRNLKLYNLTLYSYVLMNIYSFVSSVLVQQTGNKGRPYISFALTIFLIILGSNFFGLTVIGFTVTAQLTVTVGLAVSINFGLFLLGFYLHGFKFFKFFVPSGIPIFLVPFMTIIEVFSYSIRSVSLSVRLFANMMAGHTLLHIIGSFFTILFWSYSNYYLAGAAFLLLSAISVLEIIIAFLQAYIFLILFCIYLNDALTAGAH